MNKYKFPIALAGVLMIAASAFSGLAAFGHTARAAPNGGAPVSLYLTADCPLGGNITGTADNCTVTLANTGNIVVGVTVHNNSGAAVTLRSFNFDLVQAQGNPGLLTLGAGPGPDPNKDANPDANEAGYATFGCALPPPSAINGTPVGGSKAELVCFSGGADGPTIADGASLKLGDVIYVDNATADGSAALDFKIVELDDNQLNEIGSCNPDISFPMPCFSTTINFGEGGSLNTATPTLVVPTSTPCIGASCPPTETPTKLSFKTVTPTGTPTLPLVNTTPTVPVVPENPPPPPPAGPPSGNAGAGGARPILLPDTGTGTSVGANWTQALLMMLVVVAAASLAGGLFIRIGAPAPGRGSQAREHSKGAGHEGN